MVNVGRGQNVLLFPNDFLMITLCQGDSGGPLVLDEDGIQHEVGVVSTGYGCGASQYPGIYSSVSQFLTWIMKEIYDGCSVLT